MAAPRLSLFSIGLINPTGKIEEWE